MKNTRISRFKYAAAPLAISLAMISSPSFAQDAAEEEATDDDAIVVTGSRIARNAEQDSVSPVTSIGAEEIDETGVVRVEDLINNLPQTVAAQTAFISNGASGTATLNLRGLGTLRTLVLIDGRRLPQGDPFATAPDINQIPAQLIKRIEIVTGGASSVYGADAVAGVVNFIMDREFEGFKLDSGVNFYQHNNRNDSIRDLIGNREPNVDLPARSQVGGASYDFNVAFGAGFDDGRGHVTAYLGYRQIEAVLQGDYDESACALRFDGVDPSGFRCSGSSTTPAGRFFAVPSFNSYTFDGGPGTQTLRPFVFNNDFYNYAPTNYYQRPDKRYTAGFFAEYEISDSLKPYAEFQYMDDRSVAQIAFSGTFFATNETLSCGNPLLSDSFAATLSEGACTDFSDTSPETFQTYIGKRLVEGDPRANDLRHTSYRAVIGLKGDISSNWNYDVYALRGNTIYSNTYLNDLSTNRITQALNVVNSPAGPVCVNPANGCVPLNVFTNGGVTRAAFDFISIPGLQNADLETFVVSGYASGRLGDVFGAGDIGVVVGAEYRKEQYDLRVDQNFSEGTLAGQGGPTPPVNGDFAVREVFGEINIPIIQDGFIKSFSIDAGYRLSDYTTSGTSHTWKVGGSLSPVDGIKFRGVYSRAVRAPNVVELFSPQSIGLFGGTDPCATAAPVATAAECAFSGVSAAQYGAITANPAGQYNQLGGGNPGLDVEKSTSYTGGVVFDGGAFGLTGFTAQVDYFNIEVTGAIQGIGAAFALNSCTGQTTGIAAGDPRFCGLINRAPGSGSLWLGQAGFVVNTQQNIGALTTEGIDIGVGYDYALGDGSVFFDYAGTRTFSNTFENIPGLGATDCIGQFGPTCGSPQPKYRHRVRLGYRAGDGWNISLGWRFFGSVDGEVSPSTNPELNQIDAYSWFDLSASVDVTDNFRFGLGVNNILDKAPPIIGGALNPSNGNTFPGIYDPIGRQFFLRGSMRF